jgi:hypothetical protein
MIKLALTHFLRYHNFSKAMNSGFKESKLNHLSILTIFKVL